MSFIYRDRNDDDYLIGTPWVRKSDRNFQPCQDFFERLKEEERLKKESENLENFYCGGL